MSNFCTARQYNESSDETLVRFVRQSDDAAFIYLYDRYLPRIRKLARSFQGLGFDLEDLIQETTIGFFTAIHLYDFTSASFSTFSHICMRRMLIALARKSNRMSSIPNDMVVYVSDDKINSVTAANSPEQEYIAKEDYLRLKQHILSGLSSLELDVLTLYLGGYDYSEIAERLSIVPKSVDNALQRIRNKRR